MLYTSYIGYSDAGACIMLANRNDLKNWCYIVWGASRCADFSNNTLVAACNCLHLWLTEKSDCAEVRVYVNAAGLQTVVDTMHDLLVDKQYAVSVERIEDHPENKGVQMAEHLLSAQLKLHTAVNVEPQVVLYSDQ